MPEFESIVVKHKSALEFGDIILIRRKAPHWVGWAVQLVTAETYAHSCIYIGSGHIVEADPDKGVSFSELDYYKCCKMTVMRKHGKLTDDEKTGMMFQISAAIGKGYDHGSAAFVGFYCLLERLNFVKRVDWKTKKSPLDPNALYYCHELAAFVYRDIDITNGISENMILASDIRDCYKLGVVMSDYTRP